jgi:predicted AAA+ superfamily ATPase
MGRLFEQLVGLELVRHCRLSERRIQLRFWRDLSGPEVDWVLEGEDELIPIEVKWTESPSRRDTRHLETFLEEYDEASTGYVICRAPRRVKLRRDILAVPWNEVGTLVPGSRTGR